MLIMIFFISTFAVWERTYGGDYEDWFRAVVSCSGGGYLLVGGTNSFGYGGYDIYVVKINDSGDTIWTRTYGGLGDDLSFAVIETFDSGYVIAGVTDSYGAGSEDFYIIKINSDGDTIWTRCYDGSDKDLAASIVQTADSGFAVVGYTFSFGAMNKDIFLVKTDSEGGIKWAKKYGDFIQNEEAYHITQLSDFGFIITGTVFQDLPDECDIYLIRTDLFGDTLWTKTYGGRSHGKNIATDLAIIDDTSFAVFGASNSFSLENMNLWLLKINSLGDTLWTRFFSSLSNYRYNISGTVNDDGSIITVCATVLDEYYIKMIKIDELVNLNWSRLYGEREKFVLSYDVISTNDGGYIIAGVKIDTISLDSDGYIIKTDSVGYSSITEHLTQPKELMDIIDIRPNPFNQSCEIIVPEDAIVKIFDLKGRIVAENHNVPIDNDQTTEFHQIRSFTWCPENSISSGIYLIQVSSRFGSSSRKILYLK